MKKYIALTLTILSLMSFIAVFNAKGVEGYKLNKGYIQASSEEIAANNTGLDVINPSKSGQSYDGNNITSKINYQEQTTPSGIEEAIVMHTQNTLSQNPEEKTERQIDPNKPMVALTFDDGPHYKYTMDILDCLKEYDSLATFFVLGERAEKYKNVTKSIIENGNQLGNHTYNHKRLTKLSTKSITQEITKTNKLLENITNIKPSIVRPTYGSINKNVKLFSGAPLILWSIDTLDWKTRDKEKIVKEVLDNVKDGDIVLMHDIYQSTASAAEVIIKELNSQGYQLVTIDELYSAREIELVNGKVYENACLRK